MQLLKWQDLSPRQQRDVLTRPAMNESASINATVSSILQQVRQEGDSALLRFSKQFDKVDIQTLKLTTEQIAAAEQRLSSELKQAVSIAMENIHRFHSAQQLPVIDIETTEGVRCQQVTRPISAVGLYIPGGTAPLISTVLMLGIPANIAGCQRIVLCSPPPIADEILYAAQQCGISEIYQVGGAQSIAAMAFGTDSIAKVDKIFGPGNAYVTEAKRQVNQDPAGAAIDMPAGPSEVLIIADAHANPAFIAADLLSQAEHGPDSQVMLVTPDQQLAENVQREIDQQLTALSRSAIAVQALAESRIIIAQDLAQCVEISNLYGPEHLMIETQNPQQWVEKINHAGSVFLGDWSPESAGDYASGTNHVLPTYGYAATCSSLGLADFQKRMTVQQLSAKGLLNLGPTIEILAQAELLTAHKYAVTIRLNALKETTL